MFETDNILKADDSIVSGVDHSNQEIKHDDQLEEDLNEPDNPDQSDVSIL